CPLGLIVWGRQPPLAQLLARLRLAGTRSSRLDVSRVQLAATEPHVEHRLDRLIQAPVTEAVTLHADLNPSHLRVGFRIERPPVKRPPVRWDLNLFHLRVGFRGLGRRGLGKKPSRKPGEHHPLQLPSRKIHGPPPLFNRWFFWRHALSLLVSLSFRPPIPALASPRRQEPFYIIDAYWR